MHYIKDPSVGARIGSEAITTAMGRVLNNSVGQIHIHWHGGMGLPSPSFTDRTELPSIVRSLRNTSGDEAHGWMILSENDAWSSLYLPKSQENVVESPTTFVGFPMIINHRGQSSGLKKLASRLKRLFKKKKGDSRYDRQGFLGINSESVIANTTVGIIGLGGGGSHIVQQLAHLGFKNFVLCDDDHISKTNLNRLVGGTLADVNAKRLKVQIAERVIKKLHKYANLQIQAEKWEDAAESLMGCDLIFGCVDTFSARRDMEAFCRRQLIPYIDVGMDVHKYELGNYEIHGQVILSMPGKPCMHCMGFLNQKVLAEEAQRYGDAGGNPQVVWSNGILCSAAVGIAVDVLTDWSKRSREPIYLGFRGSDISLLPDKRIPQLRNHKCMHFPFNSVGDAKIVPL